MSSNQIFQGLMDGGVAAQSFVVEHRIPASVSIRDEAKFADTTGVAVVGQAHGSFLS